MKWLELFAGAGGAATGLRNAGHTALACVEWDTDACATLEAAGHPAVQADLREWSWDGDQPDAMWSSFPCQCFSIAGKRRGVQDERNGWPWTVRLLDETRPQWFVGENVAGLLQHSSKHCGNSAHCPGCYLHRVIRQDLAARFAWVGWRILDAADYGVPQHRRRVILVAGPHSIRWPEPTHGEHPLDLFGRRLLPLPPMGEALGLRCELDHSRNTEANPTQERVRPSTEPAPAIGGKGNQMVRIIGGGHNPNGPGDARRYRDLTNEPSTTIAAQHGGGASNAGPFVVWDKPAPTVTTTEVKDTRGKYMSGGPDRASDALWLATGRRRLTPDECATLQGFPDGYPFQGTKEARYRQIGNAVPPRLAEVVVRSLG